MSDEGLASSPWSAEDGGPARRSSVASLPQSSPQRPLAVTSRSVLVGTMVVTRYPGELYLLRHTGPPSAVSVVEAIDPVTLETIAESPELPGGAFVWPGGMAAHDDGGIHVVFGTFAHRLSADLEVEASRRLPRDRPYNSFVTLSGGWLVTKDFAGPYNGHDPTDATPSELLVLDPTDLAIVDSLVLAEPSVARLSALGDEIVVVGTDSLLSVRFEGGRLVADDAPIRYRTEPGQGYGWDAVLHGDLAWFLDDGEGSDRFDGSMRGRGVATAPLRLHRIDRRSGAHDSVEICGLPGGLIANPPVLDSVHGIVIGFDSGNGIVAGVDATSMEVLWRIELDHASHPLVDEEAGVAMLADFDRGRGVEDLVFIDTTTGEALDRVTTESPVQSALFPAQGFEGDCYHVSFTTLTRVFAAS